MACTTTINFTGSPSEILAAMREFTYPNLPAAQALSQSPVAETAPQTMIVEVPVITTTITEKPKAAARVNGKSGKVETLAPAAEPAEVATVEAPAQTAVETATKNITVEDLRAVAKSKADEGKQKDIKALLDEFEASSISKVYQAQYPAFFEKLNAL